MNSKIINSYYKVILFLLPIIYLFFFGRYGFEDSDSGFIVGLGWRILNGELPYKDFYYVRPPLSPYLSAIYLHVLPEHGQLLFIRLITYIMVLLTAIMTTNILDKFYNIEDLKLNKYVFSIISFVILSIGHAEFLWHTTDGIFFAVFGLWILTRYKDYLLLVFLAGILFAVSALAKQNFTIVPILAIFFSLITYSKRVTTILFLGSFFIVGLFYFWLINNGLIDSYKLQTTSVTTIKDLLKAGIINYFISDKLFLGLISLFSIIFLFIYKFNKKLLEPKIVTFIIIFIISLLNILYMFLKQNNSFLIRFDLTLPVIISIVFIYLIVSKKEELKKHYVLIFLFSIAWASSVSWGYQTPILYFVPIAFAIIYILSKYFNILSSIKFNTVFVFIIVLYSIVSNLFPYRDKPIWELDYNGLEISNKAAFILTNRDIILKHKELSSLLKEYPNSTVLPSIPHAYYLNNLNNKFKIDWAMDVEAAYDKNGLIKNINECCEYIIVEKKIFGQPVGESGMFYSSVTDYVIHHFSIIDSKNNFFNIYQLKK